MPQLEPGSGGSGGDGVTDHGALTGLSDDDHTQYVLDAGDTMSGTLDMADNIIDSPKLRDYSEEQATPSSAAGVLTLDYSTGPVFEVTLTEDVTDVDVTNVPVSGDAAAITIIFVQDGTGGWTVTFGAEFTWPGGTAPTITAAAAAVDVITAITTDNGTTWRGFISGQNFS